MEWRRLCVSEMSPLDVRVVEGRIRANGWHIVPYYAMGRCGIVWHRFGELLLCGRGDAKHLLAFERGTHRRLCGCTRTLVKRGFVVERVRSGFGKRFTTACAARHLSDLSEQFATSRVVGRYSDLRECFVTSRVAGRHSDLSEWFATSRAVGRYSDLSERLIIAAHAAFASNPS